VDNAVNLIPVPAWSESQVAAFFDSTIKEALSFGLTSIHDADTELDHIEFFKKMAEAGNLPVRDPLPVHAECDGWLTQIS